MTLLQVQDLGVTFGGVQALTDVSLSVDTGTVHGLIGGNGAGKTTLLNCVGRAVSPDRGRIVFDGHDLLTLPPHAIASRGITRTFQNLALIEGATVLENVCVGHEPGAHTARWSDFFPGRRRSLLQTSATHVAMEALSQLGLARHADERIDGLPYGVRKSIEIARALCARPRLLMLDEPTAGLNGREMADLAVALANIRSGSVLTILLITHHLEFLLRVADRVTVLELGRVIAEGPPELVQTDERVRNSYLGTA